MTGKSQNRAKWLGTRIRTWVGGVRGCHFTSKAFTPVGIDPRPLIEQANGRCQAFGSHGGHCGFGYVLQMLENPFDNAGDSPGSCFSCRWKSSASIIDP